jgi:lipopolysaccharide export system permease protein
LLKVALDIHQILMLKNKIYNYFFNEILKNFITILLTFAAIAWVVRAVNFLDLMVEDGYSSGIYFKYSILSFTSIISRFVPLAFLLSLTISVIKFERQQELLILWTTGLSKVKILNTFLLIGFFITFFQLVLSLFVNPLLLNKSRSLLGNTENLEINNVLKSNDFSDAFKGLTFYIDEKNINNELINIFIQDKTGRFRNLVEEVGDKKNSTIIAKKGFIDNNKLILFNGSIQTLNKNNEIKNVQFEKTELSLKDISTRTIKLTKIQETSSKILIKCMFSQNYDLSPTDCSDSYKKEATQTISRRLGMPLYIPLVSIIISFLLINNKEKKYSFLKKYILFAITFLILILAEILLKFTGFSTLIANSYFILPVIVSLFFYILLLKKLITEKIIK